jgi:hypothetical protein
MRTIGLQTVSKFYKVFGLKVPSAGNLKHKAVQAPIHQSGQYCAKHRGVLNVKIINYRPTYKINIKLQRFVIIVTIILTVYRPKSNVCLHSVLRMLINI